MPTFHSGSIIETQRCPHCDRQFRGNIRSVCKLMKLHLEKTHKETHPYDKLFNDATLSVTSGFIGPDEPEPKRTKK